MKHDLRQLASILRVLNDGFLHVPGLKARNVAAYSIALQDLDMKIIEAGVHRLLRTWDKPTIMPPPPAIRQAGLEALAEYLGLPSAEEAWTEARKKIAAYGVRGVPLAGGGYKPIEWSHPVVERAVEAMGGPAYMSGSDNISTDRAHWLRFVYPGAIAAWQQTVSGKPLPSGDLIMIDKGEGGNEKTE